jgi:uncharacterized protein (TIGR02147 family)
MIDLYAYLDCRAYLADYYHERSNRDKNFSHRQICNKLGQGKGSRSYFSNILAGRIRISPNLTTRLIALLDLDSERSVYFRLLVLFSQSDTAEEKDVLFEQLVKSNKAEKSTINPDTFAYFRKWYNIVIREMLDFFSFSDDYSALAASVLPPISPTQAREAIEFLNGAGLICKNAYGHYRSVAKSITTGSLSESYLINAYQMACMDLAKRSMVQNVARPQLFSTLTMSLSAETFKKIEKKLNKLRTDLVFLVEKDALPSDRVYQFNFQFFPVTDIQGTKP